MPEKRPGGSVPKQTGTTQKGAAQTGGSDAKAVKVNPGFKGGGSGKGGGGKK